MVYFTAQTATESPINTYDQEGKETISFHHQYELNVPVDTVQMVKKIPQSVMSMWPNYRSNSN
jgi:hypothetical protein